MLTHKIEDLALSLLLSLTFPEVPKIRLLNPSFSGQQIQCGTAVIQLSNRQLIQIIISLMIIDDHWRVSSNFLTPNGLLLRWHFENAARRSKGTQPCCQDGCASPHWCCWIVHHFFQRKICSESRLPQVCLYGVICFCMLAAHAKAWAKYPALPCVSAGPKTIYKYVVVHSWKRGIWGVLWFIITKSETSI